jgi:hypothetical protein
VHRRLELVGAEQAAAPGDRELHPAQRRRRAALVVDRVRSLSDDHVVARPRLRRDGQLVAHRPARDEEGRLLAGDARDLLLERDDRGVVTEDVVPDGRAQHGLAHRWRRPGDRIAPEVDHAAA